MERKTRVPSVAAERRPATVFRAPAPVATAASSAAMLQKRLGNQATLNLLAQMSASRPASEQARSLVPVASIAPSAAPTQSSRAVAPAKRETPVAKTAQPLVQPSKAGDPAPKNAAETKPPTARAAIAPAVAAVRNRAARARKPGSPADLVGSAQQAAKTPAIEADRGAAVATVETLKSADTEKKVDQKDFRAKLMDAIANSMGDPKTESEAERVMQKGAKEANEALRGGLGTMRDSAAGPLKTAMGAEPAPVAQPKQTNIQAEPVGAPPAAVSASPVVPEPLPPERLDYSSDRAPTDTAMSADNVSQTQFEQGNEPEFGSTLKARSTAESHEQAAVAKYRQGESNVQAQAKSAATGVLGKDLTAIHGVRGERIGQVFTKQSDTKDKDALAREQITNRITSVKNQTRFDVEGILLAMDTEAARIFERGLKKAESAYEKTFEEEKGGAWNWLTNWGDDWEQLIETSLKRARVKYLEQVDIAVGEVASLVETKLAAAKLRVSKGSKEVGDYVRSLDESVSKFGKEAAAAVGADFDAMISDIDGRRDVLINKLTEQYKASYKRMSAMEERLREANKSLWQRVYDATVGLIKKIIAFKDMLVSILARAASVVLDIIAHPIRFLGNLVSAVLQGVEGFVAKIDTYLIKGIMTWLFDSLGGAGLEIPDKFDLKGVISLVLQILGLTYANFRSRAVAIVGEPVVGAIEKTAEVFKIIAAEGIGGLWIFIKDQLANLKSVVLDAVFDYVKEKVITAGIAWIVSLLNPVSAFFKACKAIYDIVMFFIKRGRQIIDLVNAIIDSVAAIAAGNVGAAAAKVEAALAKAIPVAIGFLASLLSIDPSKPVKAFIEKAREPVNKAVDWVIHLAAKGAKAGVGLAKEGVKRIYNWWMKKVPVRIGEEKHTLMFEGSAKNATLVLCSEPEKPSSFLDNQGKKNDITVTKRDAAVKTAVVHEGEVYEILKGLKKFDDNAAKAASGTASKDADELAKQLDGKMNKLGAHLSGTLSTWGFTEELAEVKLPREKFTHEQKVAVAEKYTESRVKNSKGELINVTPGMARRHVVSSHDIAKHYEGVLKGKKISEAKLLIEQRGSIALARTPVEEATKVGIQAAAKSRYSKFFGYLRNLFVGDSRENSSIQEKLDRHHPEMKGKKVYDHVNHIHRAWALQDKIDVSGIEED